MTRASSLLRPSEVDLATDDGAGFEIGGPEVAPRRIAAMAWIEEVLADD